MRDASARAIAGARAAGADLVLFPELALTGYPPEDLLLKEHFLRDARDALEELAVEAEGIVVVVGAPERAEDVFNAAAVLAEGRLAGFYRKVYLPNYGVFDEQRYFQSGHGGALIELGGHRIGLTVCEDMWEPGPPASDEALAGATLLVNISASPYHFGKGLERERMFAQRARDNGAAVAFCALVGGQDELIFDGHSCVLDHTGAVIARARPVRGGAARVRRRPAGRGRRPPARRGLPARRAAHPAGGAGHRDRLDRAAAAGRPGPRPAAVGRAAAPRRGRGVRGADARPARLRREERLRPCRARALRRDRLRARRLPRGRCARSRAGDADDHAVSPFIGRDAGGRARARRGARHADLRAADRGGDGGLRRGAARRVRRAPARPHRGERAGPHPGQPADGAVEQVRLARARPPATSPRCRSATRRSTATSPAGSP